MTEQLIGGKVLPTDRDKAWDLDYSVEAPDYGEKQDYIFDGNTTIEESLKKAVIESERKIAAVQVGQMIDLTIELVLTMLRNIVVGEKPLEFAAPSGLSLTITMLVNDLRACHHERQTFLLFLCLLVFWNRFKAGSLSNQSIRHGDAVYVFPPVCAILANIRDQCFGNETLGVLVSMHALSSFIHSSPVPQFD